MLGAARFWAGFDLLLTGMLVLPVSARFAIETIYRVSGETPPFWLDFQMFFVCLAGALGVVWAVARLREPTFELVRIDVFGRIGVAGLIVYFVVVGTGPTALWVFVGGEVLGAAHQFIAWRREARESTDREADSILGAGGAKN